MTVKVAIVGVGNCASVFIQGLRFYSGNDYRGLWHPSLAGLRPKDIEVVAAFDIDSRKVGKDIANAAFASPNVARKYVAIPKTGVMVEPGISKEIPPHLKGAKLSKAGKERVSASLENSGAEILLNMISSGSDSSSEEYARAALGAKCAFVNCTPSPLLMEGKLAAGFSQARLPLIGDDLMSQFGGTVFHKGLLGFMVKRGMKMSKSYQLDVGGGSETQNTMDESIKMAKRGVKTTSVAREVPYKFETIAGTTDFVDYMGNDRTSYFWFEGSGFMNSGITVDVYLRSSDGANAGNILLDVIRATNRCMKTGKLGPVADICAYGFKSPPRPVKFEEAYSKFAALYIR